MAEPSQTRKHAVVLMRKALRLLDEAGEKFAAAHLQLAIDLVTKSQSVHVQK